LTNFELLTLLFSTIAAVISVISLIRTRKVQEEQIRLERVAAELSQRQLERIAKEDDEKTKAYIHVTLEQNGADYRFWIRNQGKAKAKDVWVTLDSEGPDNPIVGSEYKKKIPIPYLNSGGEVSLIAAIHMGSCGKYKISARWVNEDQSQANDEFFLSV
jgi:hypothetical protein